MNSNFIGSSFDSFLREEDILVETEALALKRMIAFTLTRVMFKGERIKLRN